MKNIKNGTLFILATVIISCNGSSSKTGTNTVSTSPDYSALLTQDLGEAKGNILKLDNFLMGDFVCTSNCGPHTVSVQSLIKPGKVNSPTLENDIFGFDEVGGFSWNQLGYFGSQTTKDFFGDLLENQILVFDLNKLCGLIQILPKGSDGKFLEGSYMVNTADFPIEEKCSVLPASLNMDGIILVENTQIGSFEKIIKFNGVEIYYGNTDEKLVYGEYSIDKRRRMTFDKIQEVLMVENVTLTPIKDSLVRIYFDETLGEASMLVNHTGLESVQFTYAIGLGDEVPRFGKLNIRAESLGGVDSSAPQAADCIDLTTGLISNYDYSSCPVGNGLAINDSNAGLFNLSFPAFSLVREELNFTSEQEIFMPNLN